MPCNPPEPAPGTLGQSVSDGRAPASRRIYDGPLHQAEPMSDEITKGGGDLCETGLYMMNPCEKDFALQYERLRSLCARQEAAREEEKKRLARELHDELGQCLTALRLDLAWMEPRLSCGCGELRARANSMDGHVNRAFEALQRVISGLRPAALDDLGLAAALEWQVAEFRRLSGIACEFTFPNRLEDIHPEDAIVLYRILQESLTNILRHSDASRTVIRLIDGDAGLRLEVEDDGRGIPVSKLNHPESYGLQGMRERMAGRGGTLEISSRQCRCVIRAILPRARKEIPCGFC